MIKIEVIDPHSHTAEELIRVARYLMECAGVPMIEVNPAEENKTVENFIAAHKKTYFLDDPVLTSNEENSFEPGLNSETVANIVNRDFVPKNTAEEETAPAINNFPVPPPPPFAEAPVVMQERAITPGFAIPPSPSALIDDLGQEWNPQIHSRTQSKMPDGSFKLKRGLNKRTSAAGNTFITKSAEVTPAPKTPAPEPVAVAVPPPEPAAAVAPPAPVAPIKSEPPPVVEDEFEVLMEEIINLFTEEKLAAGDIISFANEHGVASIPLLSGYPHLWPLLRQKMKDLIKLRGYN